MVVRPLRTDHKLKEDPGSSAPGQEFAAWSTPQVCVKLYLHIRNKSSNHWKFSFAFADLISPVQAMMVPPRPDPLNLPFQHFATVYLDQNGIVKFSGSPSIGNGNRHIFTPELKERFLEAAGIKPPSKSPYKFNCVLAVYMNRESNIFYHLRSDTHGSTDQS